MIMIQIFSMKSFKRIVALSILLTYLVILAGAIVRGTGSGLGCPDWPRCFGQWVPPTDISELPANYKEIYKIAGKTIADFDPFKTWTEYINRLAGVLLGFAIIATFLKSFSIRRIEPSIPWFCGGLLLLVIIQGGVGAVVVSTHLKPFIITIHMVLAVLLLFGLIYLEKYTADLMNESLVPPVDKKVNKLLAVAISLGFIQMILGTQVRQQVDHLIRDTQAATAQTVISMLDWVFYVHRSFSILLLVFLGYIAYYLTKNTDRVSQLLGFFVFLVAVSSATSGVILNYWDFPAQAQPPHLFLGVLLLGLLYKLKLRLRGSLIS